MRGGCELLLLTRNAVPLLCPVARSRSTLTVRMLGKPGRRMAAVAETELTLG